MGKRNGVYTRSPCLICSKLVSNAGYGYVAHMRMHVSRGEVREERAYYNKRDYGLRFVKT